MRARQDEDLHWTPLLQAMVLGFITMWVFRFLLPLAGELDFPEWYGRFAFQHPRIGLYMFDTATYLLVIAPLCAVTGYLVARMRSPYTMSLAFIAALPLFLSELVMPFFLDPYHRAWLSAYPALATTRALLALLLLPFFARVFARDRKVPAPRA